MPTQNLELLNSLMDQVKKEWSIPADCNDNTILFDVIKEAMIRYEAEVNIEVKKRFEELPEPLDLE